MNKEQYNFLKSGGGHKRKGGAAGAPPCFYVTGLWRQDGSRALVQAILAVRAALPAPAQAQGLLQLRRHTFVYGDEEPVRPHVIPMFALRGSVTVHFMLATQEPVQVFLAVPSDHAAPSTIGPFKFDIIDQGGELLGCRGAAVRGHLLTLCENVVQSITVVWQGPLACNRPWWVAAAARAPPGTPPRPATLVVAITAGDDVQKSLSNILQPEHVGFLMSTQFFLDVQVSESSSSLAASSSGVPALCDSAPQQWQAERPDAHPPSPSPSPSARRRRLLE